MQVQIQSQSGTPAALATEGSKIDWKPVDAAITPAPTGPIKQKDISQALKVVTDIPLTGSTARLDYQSLDLQRGLLFIAHLGDSSLIVVDIKANKNESLSKNC